jgi:HD-like signal output (HDOD) protein
MDALENTLGSIKDLPTLPAVIKQVGLLIENDETDINKIADIIMTDAALSIRIIRLVNSAFYGLRNRVTSLQHAVVALGLRSVYNLMLGLSVVKIFKNEKSEFFDPVLLWQHSFGCALVCEKLSTTLRYPFPDETFIAGLLHDLGRLALDQFAHDTFALACTRCREANISLVMAEKEIFGFDHAQAGAWLSERMNIPDSFVSVIRYHHCLSQIPQEAETYRDLIAIVEMANRICFTENIGNSGERLIDFGNEITPFAGKEQEVMIIGKCVKDRIHATMKGWSM